MDSLKIQKRITYKEERAIDQYLREVAKIPLITPEEEVVLAKKIKEGDKEALEKLVKANLRFVISVAKQYPTGLFSLSDLINEGNEGLIKAARRFDETRGIKFISYAVWWIRQKILELFYRHGRTIRIPMNILENPIISEQSISRLYQELERDPTITELAEEAGVDIERVEHSYTRKSMLTISLDQSEYLDDSRAAIEIIPVEEPQPDVAVENEGLRKTLLRVLQILSPHQKYVFERCTGFDGKPATTFSNIADELGFSRERVRQLYESARRKILEKKDLEEQLRQYL